MANYENITLEKGLYTTGKSFTSVLEELDPSENYIGTPLEGLDAYQRQLKRFDIKVSGPGSDTLEKFFKTQNAAVLFPEYISRSIRQGVFGESNVEKIIATVTNIDSYDYRSITSSTNETEMELKDMEEGYGPGETVIKLQSNLIHLKKAGRYVMASYESLRFQRLDLITVTLKQIGSVLAKTRFKDAVNVLMNGDGNENAITTYNTATSGQLTYEDLISFWNKFDPHNLTTMIASPAMTAKLLNLPEFRDAAAGLNFHATGKMITPFGAELIRSSAVDENTIIGLDRSCAIELVQAGDVSVEFDKLIDRQLERAVITTIFGFAKIYPEASKALSIAAAGAGA